MVGHCERIYHMLRNKLHPLISKEAKTFIWLEAVKFLLELSHYAQKESASIAIKRTQKLNWS